MAEAVFCALTKISPCVGPTKSADAVAHCEGEGLDVQTMKTLGDHGIADYEHVRKKTRDDDNAIFDYVLTISAMSLQKLQRSFFCAVEDNVVEFRGCKVGQLALFGYVVGEAVDCKEVEIPSYQDSSSFRQVYQQVIEYVEACMEQVLDDDKELSKAERG